MRFAINHIVSYILLGSMPFFFFFYLAAYLETISMVPHNCSISFNSTAA